MAEVRGRKALRQDAGLSQGSSSEIDQWWDFKDAEKVVPAGCGLDEGVRESLQLKVGSEGVSSPTGLGARQMSSVPGRLGLKLWRCPT